MAELGIEVADAKQKGFVAKHSSNSNGTHHGERLLAVIGIFTGFGRRKNRDAIRKSWVQKGKRSLLGLFLKHHFFVNCYHIKKKFATVMSFNRLDRSSSNSCLLSFNIA